MKKFIKGALRGFLSEGNKYDVIGANTFSESLKLNGFSISRDNDISVETEYINTDITEAIDFEFDLKGGIIVFSVNVNAENVSKNALVNKIKQKIETIKNTLYKDKKINKILSKYDDVYGVTIGKFVKGRYKAKDGSLYDEKSLSIEIIGIKTDILNKVAEDLAQEFKQETVLVKNYQDNRIYLVKP